MPSNKTAQKAKTDPASGGCSTISDAHSLFTPDRAVELMKLFKVLANDMRLRLLHALACHGELAGTELADYLGLKRQSLSNQLVRLQDRRILHSRRQGNTVYYRIANPYVIDLLDRGLSLLDDFCGES